MNDTILLAGEPKEVERVVRLAFRNYWNLSALAESPLAQSWLVEDSLLAGDERYGEARGYALRAVLDWALAKLLGQGTHSAEISVDVLTKRYIEGLSNKQYADLRMIGAPAAHARRKTAVQRVVKLLRQALLSPLPSDAGERQQGMIALRYQDCTEDEQILLRLLTIFREPVSLSVLADVAPKELPPDSWHHLRALNLIVSDDRLHMTQGAVHQELRPYLLKRVTPDESEQWNAAAGSFYVKPGAIIEALYHLKEAGQLVRAARLILHHVEQGNDLPIERLRERLAAFRRTDLPTTLWAQVKILAGRMAELCQEIDVAQREYEAALVAEEPLIKAEAYYQLANLHEQRDIQVAFVHYTACQQLLQAINTPKGINLLVNSYIRVAWLCIEHLRPPDSERARENLTLATHLIRHAEGQGSQWQRLQADLNITWGIFYVRCSPPNPALELQHLVRAYQHAYEAGDKELQVNTTYNLGVAYMRRKRYDEARQEFEKSQALALETGNRRMAALSQKGIGDSYCGAVDYERAIPCYQRAYDYFRETGNHYWQSAVGEDLAEAHAALGNTLQAKAYFAEALQLGSIVGNQRVLADLEALAKRYIELSADLNEREQQAIGEIRRHGSINNRQYKELTQSSRATATRDLRELLQKGICVKVGEARGTRYQLAAQYL
jgi:tetratricopeptide (TPR) repeat protein